MDERTSGDGPRCGAPLTAGQGTCPQGGSLGSYTDGGATSAQGGLTWEADIGLLTNPEMLRQFARLLGVTGLVMFGLLSFLSAVQGDWESIPKLLLATLVGVGVLALLMLLVVLLFFRNRYRARFAVTEKGVAMASVDRRARAGSRLAAALGVLARSPAAAGAGTLAMAREEEAVSWRSIASVRYHPRWYGVTLRNRWRTVAFLACTRENYAQVVAFVRAHAPAQAVGTAAKGRSPLPRLLGRSALVVVATLPVFLLPYPFEIDLLAPLLMLCFALATVWLIPVFGWVVIALALWMAGRIAFIALGVRESAFGWGAYYTYEVLDAGDWLALSLAAAGLAYLVIASWRAARGCVPSALGEDSMPPS